MNKLKKMHNERIRLLEAPVASKTRKSIMGIVKILRQILSYIDERDFPEFRKVMNVGIEKGIEITNQEDTFFSNLISASENKQQYIIVSLADMPISICDIIEQFIFTNQDLIQKIKKAGDFSITEYFENIQDLKEKANGANEIRKISESAKKIVRNGTKISDGFGKFEKKDNLFMSKMDMIAAADNLMNAKVEYLLQMTDLIREMSKSESKIEKTFSDVSGEASQTSQISQEPENGGDSRDALEDAGFTIQLQGDKLVLASSNGGPKVNINPQLITTFFMALMKSDQASLEQTKVAIEKDILKLAKTLRPKK